MDRSRGFGFVTLPTRVDADAAGNGRSRSRRSSPNRGHNAFGDYLSRLPPPPTQWAGQEDSMRSWLNAKAEADRRERVEDNLPPPPTQWAGQEDSMRRWLDAKAEAGRRDQEEERLSDAQPATDRSATVHEFRADEDESKAGVEAVYPPSPLSPVTPYPILEYDFRAEADQDAANMEATRHNEEAKLRRNSQARRLTNTLTGPASIAGDSGSALRAQ